MKVTLSPFWLCSDPSYTSHGPGGNIVRCWKWTLSHIQSHWSKNAWRDSSLTNDFPQFFPPSLQWEWMAVCCLRTEGVSHIRWHWAAQVEQLVCAKTFSVGDLSRTITVMIVLSPGPYFQLLYILCNQQDVFGFATLSLVAPNINSKLIIC